jgi:hypothetical protein
MNLTPRSLCCSTRASAMSRKCLLDNSVFQRKPVSEVAEALTTVKCCADGQPRSSLATRWSISASLQSLCARWAVLMHGCVVGWICAPCYQSHSASTQSLRSTLPQSPPYVPSSCQNSLRSWRTVQHQGQLSQCWRCALTMILQLWTGAEGPSLRMNSLQCALRLTCNRPHILCS